MLAALRFVTSLEEEGLLSETRAIRVEFYGSLGATGRGHGSDRAILMGLEGEAPDRVEPAAIAGRVEVIRSRKEVLLLGKHRIKFSEVEHMIFNRHESLPYHSNGLRITAFGETGKDLKTKVYYSVGGGFVVDEKAAGLDRIVSDHTLQPFPFHSANELLQLCKTNKFSISRLMLENEKMWRTEADIHEGLLKIWGVMQECVRNGCRNEGVLPGGLKVKRRAAALHRQLSSRSEASLTDPLTTLDWVNLYALAVNEENANCGRVVTAPTNGAAGIIPAIIHYYTRFVTGANEDGVVRFLLTAAAIGILYKENASISGAEVGCQGEIGSACSMASGALAEVLGGTPAQVENAAEIGMEHNLGLTCDPVGGLVQVPCIERNAMAAVKAINAARMALHGNGVHFVSLDQVIKTMRDTGADMKTKYKETSRGGLAVNVIAC